MRAVPAPALISVRRLTLRPFDPSLDPLVVFVIVSVFLFRCGPECCQSGLASAPNDKCRPRGARGCVSSGQRHCCLVLQRTDGLRLSLDPFIQTPCQFLNPDNLLI